MPAVRSTQPGQSFLGRVQKSARARGIEVCIDLDFLQGLWEYQTEYNKTRCALTGEELFYTGSRDLEFNVSLDRVDSDYGYVPGNLAYVTKQANVSKHTVAIDRFIYLCSQVVRPIMFDMGKHDHVCRNKQYRGSQLFSGEKMSTYRRRAKEKALDFSLTAAELDDLALKQRFLCGLSGERLFPETASIDRINIEKGYTADNVQLVLKEVNFMRSEMTVSDFLLFCKKVYEWNIINRKGLIRFDNVSS